MLLLSAADADKDGTGADSRISCCPAAESGQAYLTRTEGYRAA